MTPGQTPYLLRLASGRVQFFFDNGVFFAGTVTVTDGVWHHVAVARIGSAVSIVVDGAVDATLTHAPLVHAMNGPVVFGCFLDVNDVPVPGSFLNGSLDEVRIWNVGRTLAQLQAARNLVLSPSTPGLVGSWRLDEGAGQAVLNQSGLTANGTLGNTSAVAANDPAWALSGGPVLGYPCGGSAGNPNSALATLMVNGAGLLPLSGPFQVQLPPAGNLTFSWAGPAGRPLVLIGGANNPAHTNVPGLGILDVGMPPTFSDLFVLFDGSQPLGSLFYTLGPAGTATQTFTLPPSLSVGPLLNIQGLVFQPPGTTPFGLLLTAAFNLNG